MKLAVAIVGTISAVVSMFGPSMLCPSLAHAEPTDGVYGRFDGDLLLVGGAGMAIERTGPQLLAGVSLSYLSTAGLYVRFTDALGRDEALFARSLSTGLELRPLFLARYALDLERGPEWIDLWIDSISLEIGPYFFAPTSDDFRPGLELALGFELPIASSATGLYAGVKAIARFPEEAFDAAGPSGDLLDRGAMLAFSLSWHHILDAGLVDLDDGPKQR